MGATKKNGGKKQRAVLRSSKWIKQEEVRLLVSNPKTCDLQQNGERTVRKGKS